MVAESRSAPNVSGVVICGAFGGDLVGSECVEVCLAAAVQDDVQLGPVIGAQDAHADRVQGW